MRPSHLTVEQSQRQSQWLAAARSKLLRRADIARRRMVLDLGCGSGAVTEELVRRSGGIVVALDRSRTTLADGSSSFSGAKAICADGEHLPLAEGSFDLVFCQFSLLWMNLPATIREVHRVLQPGGVLVALEPDYGGLIEYPPEITVRDVWLAGLTRAGADPYVGRKLPAILAAAGFRVRVDLLDRLLPPSPLRFDLLGGLPLTEQERETLRQAQQAGAALDARLLVAHLPMFLVIAEVPCG